MLLLLAFYSCTGSKAHMADASHPSFNVIEATYEEWHAGRKDGGSGTDYQLIAVIKSDHKLEFDSIWIQQKGITLPLAVGRMRGPVSNQPVTFQKGDTILLVASFSANDVFPKAIDSRDTGRTALISFKEEGRLKKATIPALTKKEGQPRPQY